MARFQFLGHIFLLCMHQSSFLLSDLFHCITDARLPRNTKPSFLPSLLCLSESEMRCAHFICSRFFPFTKTVSAVRSAGFDPLFPCISP